MKKIIITGGGTGGHVFSAIATADEIKKRFPEADILFVGAKNYLEETAVPKAGYPIELMPIHRIKRHQKWKNLKHLFYLPVSLFKSYRIIKKFKPDAAIGTGGFATGPILLMAQWFKIPTFIQDHNSYPGLTTQLLAKKATKIHTAYKEIEQYLDPSRIVLTGNPVRSNLFNNLPTKPESVGKFGLKEDVPIVLILGGSGGAEPINKAIETLIPHFKEQNIQVIWQTGKDFYQKYDSYNDE
ncbi:MAG TPA: UDP-N-acetylglucosamine--N-acetylmuramyl-(pentapeptide) pyrophosphoryl-undecaprenol N-acetylglucosamine transferase, partial [Flavobacteriales bacterium]|nr:UDP-N-acetylglucosamine--N-acetylmuramyl-(pentapeptide) pyrophosphoryl-undecaprenol N-acetylglucosamine transferase [Flavobacteriales bacterium]